LRETIDDDDDQFLIVPIDMEDGRQGLLSGWIWQWLDVDRSRPDWRQVVAITLAPLKLPPPPPPFGGLLGLLPPQALEFVQHGPHLRNI
jgi:hypothetical protein